MTHVELDPNLISAPGHHCQWVFLRQEERPMYSNDRIRNWTIHDVFYCQVDPGHPYLVAHIRTEEPSTRSFDRRVVTWRALEARGEYWRRDAPHTR